MWNRCQNKKAMCGPKGAGLEYLHKMQFVLNGILVFVPHGGKGMDERGRTECCSIIREGENHGLRKDSRTGNQICGRKR